MRPIKGDKYVYVSMAYELCNKYENIQSIIVGFDDGTRGQHMRNRFFTDRRMKHGNGMIVEVKRDAAYQGYRRNWPYKMVGTRAEFYKPSEWKRQ